MDNPIEIDLAHERSPSLSDDDESLFRNDNSQHANTQPNDNQDNDRYIERNSTPGLQQDMVDSSTSDDEECMILFKVALLKLERIQHKPIWFRYVLVLSVHRTNFYFQSTFQLL